MLHHATRVGRFLEVLKRKGFDYTSRERENKTVEAVSVGAFISSSMEPRSIFVVVSYHGNSACSSSILQLQPPQKGDNSGFAEDFNPPPSPLRQETRPHLKSLTYFETAAIQKEYVAHFGRPQGPAIISWLFSRSTSTEEDLYMVPYWDHQDHKIPVPLHGFIFNLTTNVCRAFEHPMANKYQGHVVNLSGYLYFIAEPLRHGYTPALSFERCHPAGDSWEPLEPFPIDAIFRLGYDACIVATAVCDDTILFNMGGVEIWAYKVSTNKWYPVEVEDKKCYSIVGEAVVQENTIYALAKEPFNLILALSLESKNDNDDPVFKCRLSKILVKGMKPFSIKDSLLHTRHLCVLGKDNFCLVESCTLDDFPEHQPIQLTNIELKEKHSMTATGVCGHLLRIPDGDGFGVDLCFSLPDCKTTAFKAGKSFVFPLNPYPQSFDPHKKRENLLFREPKNERVTASKASATLGDGAVSGRSKSEEEGHSISVRNISPFATCNQLEQGLEKFGPLDGITIMINKEGKASASVEFKSATSKQNAVKASRIRIGDCEAVIE